MKTSDFGYHLPEELIAQDPLADRSASRMMVLDRKSGAVEDRHFHELLHFLNPGDTLVINDTRVIPARLFGRRVPSGGAVELLLLKRKTGDIWETLVRPGRKCRPGAELTFGDGRLRATVLETAEDGNRLVRFHYSGIFEEILDALGEMPLPPYITHKLQDRTRYQTVYAAHDGSAAAPTAGLHFTQELLQETVRHGVQIARVTLHVGLGTFRPVRVEDVAEHRMHSEYYQISQEAADIINGTHDRGGKVIAVGTTSCRTLESAADADGRIRAAEGWTDIFIYPGYTFKVTEGLITNFHLPESTLIMLVSAFAGKEHVMDAYRHAVEERYRFFSFGDAMLIE